MNSIMSVKSSQDVDLWHEQNLAVIGESGTYITDLVVK